MEKNRRGGNAWIGWLVFIFLVFGSRFLPPVANWLSQATGFQISTPMLVVALVGLAVVASIVSSIAQGVTRSSPSDEPRLPTAQPPPRLEKSLTPPRAPTLPSSPGSGRVPRLRPPTGEQHLPSPPRFEPIIDPRVLTFGIVGLAIFGGIFLAVLVFSGSLP